MTKKILCAAAVAVLCAMSSCSGSKNAANNYYSNPSGDARVTPKVTETRRVVRESDRLAAEETTNMRAVGVGNDLEEKYARREAMNDARNTLAGYLQATIINLVDDYHKKASANGKKFSETTINDYMEGAVAQKVSTRMIGLPEIYDLSDGSVSVYVCLELTTPTDKLLGDIHDQLTKDEIIGIDYDKQKFIEDNKDRIKELREKAEKE